MDPQLAALMARRRRKADGVDSSRDDRATVPLEEDKKEEASKEQEGAAAPAAKEPEKAAAAAAAATPATPVESPQRKPVSVSSIKLDELYSPSLLDTSDRSSVTMEKSSVMALAAKDKSNKSGIGAPDIDKSNRSGIGDIDKSNRSGFSNLDKSNRSGVANLDKSHRSGAEAAKDDAAKQPGRLKRQKSKGRDPVSAEEISELDAVVAAVDAAAQEAKPDPSPTKPSSVSSISKRIEEAEAAKKSSSKSKSAKEKSASPTNSPATVKKPSAAAASTSTSSSSTPSNSPGALKKVREAAAPKTPPPPPPPARSKSTKTSKTSSTTSSSSKLRRSQSEDNVEKSPGVHHSKEVRRGKSNEVSQLDESSSHRRASRRRSNESETMEDSSTHRRASRRRSNETEPVEDTSSHRRAGRRKSNDSGTGSSPGRHKASRRGTREGDEIRGAVSEDTMGSTDSNHGKVRRRKSNDSFDGNTDPTKSPGRHGKGHRSSRSSRNADSSPGRHKHHRSSSRENIDTADDLLKSPGTTKSHRSRRQPSRSSSKSQPGRTKSSSQRPRLPATLEDELSEQVTARSKHSKNSSPRHKMPTTMEEELIAVATSPRSSGRKGLANSHEDERSLSGDELTSSKARSSRRDASGKQRTRKSRKNRSASEEIIETKSTQGSQSEYEEDLRDNTGDTTNSGAPFKPDFSDQSSNMNFMFEDSSNFDNSFVIDLTDKTNHSTKQNSVGSLSGVSQHAFNDDAFGGSFAMDFGNFAETDTANANNKKLASSNHTAKSNDSGAAKVDAFGFSASEMGGAFNSAAAAGPRPSFGQSLDFGGDTFGGDWGGSKPESSKQLQQPQNQSNENYDKSPIDKPPSNQVESFSTKIKWISPHPNLVVAAASSKSHTPPPVANPLNGNLIVCKAAPSPTKSKSYEVCEWSPQRKTQLAAVQILSTDLKRKVVQKYGVTPESVDTVWTVSAGIHRTATGTEGLRVAALIDLTILGDRQKDILRLIAVWNWNPGDEASLQSVLSPPSGSDFTYDTKSLKVADGCVFVAGASAKGPCVFLNKPTVRETWSANFIAKNTDLRISHMAITNASKSPPDPVPTSSSSSSGNSDEDNGSTVGGSFQAFHRLPYLAISLNDGSLSVWTYEPATKLTGKTKDAVRKLIFPMCRLHALKFLQTCPITPWSSKDRSESEKTTSTADSAAELGICTHLEWIPYRASSHKQLLLLAATFQGAMCLYHVALPKVQDKSSGKKGYVEIKAPTDKTPLNQTISLRPFCFSKWPTTHHRTSCAFVDLGPHVPPSLVLLMRGNHESPDYAKIALVTCPVQARVGSHKSKSPGDPLSFYVWATQEWTNKKSSSLPRGLVHSALTSTRGILYYTDTGVQELEYRTNTRFPLGASGNGSIPFGLTTSGGTYWADNSKSSSSAGAGVLSLYTTYHCERFKSTLSTQDPSTPTLLEWTNPGRRHWLVQTLAGDCKDSGSKPSKAGEEIVKGGAQSTLVCELVAPTKSKSLYPYRLAKNPYSTRDKLHAAVWFRSLCGTTTADFKSIGLVERDGDGIYGVVQLVEGRDAVFLPSSESDEMPRALVVSPNGGSVALWKRTKTAKALSSPWKKDSSSKACRPILGVDPKDPENYVELRQYVSTRFQNQLSLLAIGSRSNKFCLVAGPLVDEDGLEDWSQLLPNTKENPVLWLDEREQVTLVVPLPSEGSIRGGLGVATTQRILIVSPDLQILAAAESELPPGSLVPMGSYTVAYCSPMDHKLRYLSGLSSQMGRSGIIANLSIGSPCSYAPWLVGIRPDRFLYNVHQNGTRLVERGQSGHSFLLPLATTRPALLLEPMLANAIATGGKDAGSQPFLRTVLEKFGRKVATMSHGEGEGIGNSGSGITPRVFELLEHYKLKAAASWLLTGTVRFDRSANSRLLPSFLPVTVKTKAAFDADTHLHLIASGDQYFTEYVKSPDNNMSSTLPRPSDPTASLCRQFGRQAIRNGNVADAMKMLDITGTQASDSMILQMAMALQLDPAKNTQSIIDALHQQDTGKVPSAVASLAALASELKKGTVPSTKFHQKWLQSLAPSVQRSRKVGRHRARLLGESSLANIAMTPKIDSKLFSKELPESKLVWNEGPSGEKENLLMLDDIGEWFGRRRPIVFGKEGAKRAEERGASTLAGILHSNDEDDDSFGGENDDFNHGWVDGVGEGMKDEDKLSAYYRFSEGEEEDSAWQDEGIADITKFGNTAVIVGNSGSFALEESNSGVDEGESGKVKAIYDLVYGQSGVGQASALAIPAARGGSLDLGVMHGPENASRQKCTMEFWVWVPESIKKEIVLVRRTFGSSADDLDTVCKASDKGNFLWELGLQKSGELEFRTIAGKSVKTKPEKRDDNANDEEDETPTSSVHFSRWNHICIVMKQESITSSSVSLIVRGTRKTNAKTLSFSPPGFEVDDFSGASALDPKLEKSHLVYGLDHPKGFRMTELRVWALERKDDDIKTLMREYLESAEIKRKFRIKIKKKGGADKGGMVGLAPPRGSGVFTPPNDSPRKSGLLAPPGARKSGLLAPPKSDSKDESPTKQDLFGPSDFGTGTFDGFGSPKEEDSAPVSFGSDGFGSAFGSDFKEDVKQSSPSKRQDNMPFEPDTDDIETDDDHDFDDEEEIEISPLWESAIPLSKQVRTSAASALIRGPPATRHFGGNRGGLPDYRELERFGVGAISICGSEKTIVWRDDQVPPGLTYPIGASGAIVSDQMDGDGSEFLCCFMAKDKRMVVFELSTRTIVVELQMTTKLNYWRFLPPEAGEDTLCFMLITPVGGFHWMPLDESPRPRQVWKRGPELQGKKIVSYEEGGTNGYEGQDMLSKVGLVLVTDSADMVNGGSLEAWLVPVCGDSQVVCASYEILGACLCQPPGLEYEAFMPLLLFVVEEKNELVVCVSAVTQEGENSIGLTEVMTDALIEQGPYSSFDFEPPSLAMGTYPEVLCCSLGTTVVVIVRRKGLVVAYELADSGLELIAQENVGHYVVDAVMRYNASEGGAEIVLLMGDAENRRDGRVGTFCFRPAV